MDVSGFDLGYRPVSYWTVSPAPAERDYSRAHPMTPDTIFLPPAEAEEVTIARFSLKSTTNDIIELRARPDGSKIRYRVVDEYWDTGDSDYYLPTDTSDQPLTLGRLIELIDSVQWGGGYVGIVDGHREFNRESDPEDIYDFTSVSSDFYPELGAYYDREAEWWLFEQRRDSIEADLAEASDSFPEQLLRLRSSPRKPEDFPSRQRVSALTDEDIEALRRWASSHPGVTDVTIAQGPVERGYFSGEVLDGRSFRVAWTIGGSSYTRDFSRSDNPRVADAFRYFQETVANWVASEHGPLAGDADTSGSEAIASATVLVGQADSYWSHDQLTEAEELYLRACALVEQTFGPDDRRVIPYLSNVADSYLARGESARAETVYRRILEIEEQGKLDPSRTLTKQAIACYQIGDIEQALKIYYRAQHQQE